MSDIISILKKIKISRADKKELLSLSKNKTVCKEVVAAYGDSIEQDEKKLNEFLDTMNLYMVNHLQQIIPHLNKKSKILELGAGTGFSSSFLYDRGFHNILATDINPFDYSGLLAIKRINKKVRTKIMSFEKISLPKNSFDCVFMISALHHSSNINAVAEQVSKVLKKDKFWFIIGEPIKGLFDGKNSELEGVHNQGYNDHYYSFRTYKKEIERAGFKVEIEFPLELHKFLNKELKDNCKTPYKKFLLSIASKVYQFKIGQQLIRKIYPFSLYFIGSHSVMRATKIK